MQSINTKLTDNKKSNRERFINFVRNDPPLSNTLLKAKFENRCLHLLDTYNYLFSDWQLITFIQVVAISVMCEVDIFTVKTEGEEITIFDTGLCVLKVTYNFGQDLYETELRNTKTNRTVTRKDVYMTDLIDVIKSIQRKMIENQDIF